MIAPALKKIRKNWVVLDAGCGNAANAREIAAECRAVACLDNSREMLGYAKKNLAGVKNAETVFGSMARLPFGAECFDAVTCTAALHHLNAGDRKKAAKEFWRVLKPCGTVFATLWRPRGHGKWGLIKWGRKKRKYFFPGNKELKKLFGGAGFRRVRVKEEKRNVFVEAEK